MSLAASTSFRRLLRDSVILGLLCAGLALSARSLLNLSAVHSQHGFWKPLILFLAVLAAVASAYWFSRRHTQAIREIAGRASQLAGLTNAPGDELAQISSAIESMQQESAASLEALSRDRNQLLAVLGGMVEGVIAVDGDERIVHINSSASQAIQLDPALVASRKYWVAVRLPELNQIFKETMETNSVQQRELQLKGQGADQVFELYASPLKDQEGRNGGAVLVMHDVTGLRRLEDMRRDFVANVSHELKTPVTAIHAMAETMLDDAEMAEETRRHFLRRINEQGERLSNLVGDLLSLSRIESSADLLDREDLDLRELAREALAMHSGQAESRGLSLRSEFPPDCVSVHGERESLRQAVGNLIDNAIKYTPAGGKIVLKICAERGLARLSVSDTGIGIEVSQQGRLFERFYRVDKARSRELGGTGLGLAIVKHVTLAHGGTVEVASTPGQGSTFTMLLPLHAVGS